MRRAISRPYARRNLNDRYSPDVLTRINIRPFTIGPLPVSPSA